MSIIPLIVALIIIGLAFWVVRTLSSAFKIPEPITAVIYVVLVVIVVVWLLQSLTGTNLGTLRIS